MKVVLDRSLCVGSGDCVKLAPTAFVLDEEGYSRVTDASSVDEATLRLCAELCPSGAIRVEEDAAGAACAMAERSRR